MSYILTRKIYETVEPGVYAATITEVIKEDGDFGEQIRFTFSLDGSESTLLAWASAKLSNKSKLGQWVTGILGEMPERLDIQTLVGRSVNILVNVVTKEDGSKTNRVENVTMPKQTSKPKPKPQPIEPPAEEEMERI